MKKLIFLPLMVLPLLTGCNNSQKEPKFSLAEWLTNIEEGTPTYFDLEVYDESGHRDMNILGGLSDYQYKFAEFIKDNATSMSLCKYEVKQNSPHVRYEITRKMGEFERLYVSVYEERLTMYAIGYGVNVEYPQESTCYFIPKEVGKKIIEEGKTKWLEMDAMADEAYLEVYNDMSLESFCSYVTTSETKPTIAYRNEERTDANLDLLDDIKELVCIETNKFLSFKDDAVTYGIDKDYMMTIGKSNSNDKPMVLLTKYYDTPAQYYDVDWKNECKRYYSISDEKFNNFMAVVKAM